MATWAKEDGNRLIYATAADFPGVVNWSNHDMLCRSRGWLPLQGEPESRNGFSASPKTWHVDSRSETRVEPRQRTVGDHIEMIDTEIVIDRSAIVIDEWQYEEIPVPSPMPKTYSKLRLYDALVEANIWNDVEAAIEASGQMKRWEIANDLSTDYAPFAQLLEQLRQVYGDELTDRILAAAEV